MANQESGPQPEADAIDPVAEPSRRDREPTGSDVARTVVVIVTHAGAGDRLDRCVDSVRRSGGADAILVVDNSDRPDRPDDSSIGASPDLDTDADSGAIRVHTLRVENRGYGAALNDALARPEIASAEYVALLNDDVIVDDGWLATLVEAIDVDAAIGAAQPKLVLADTDPSLVNSLGVRLDEHGAGVDIAYRTLEAEAPTETAEIAIFSAGAVLFRRAFLEDLDGFDERLFLYYEDVDLALRGAERGWTYRCVPASRVVHAMGATTDDIAAMRLRLQERNRLLIAARFGSVGAVRRALWLSIRKLRHPPRFEHARALGAAVVRFPRAIIERWQATRRPR